MYIHLVLAYFTGIVTKNRRKVIAFCVLRAARVSQVGTGGGLLTEDAIFCATVVKVAAPRAGYPEQLAQLLRSAVLLAISSRLLCELR
jgi:hypothetical protein